MKILSATQFRQWDEYTMLHEPISSLELMERAAGQCTNWLTKKYGHSKPVKIFCGKGNNGGDGLAIARQFAETGIISDVFILEFGSSGNVDFQANLTRLHHYPVRIHFVQHSDFLPLLCENDLIIDALLGSGLKRPLEGLFADTVHHINRSKSTVVAIDLPTGLFADKAISDSTVVKATFTLTFQALKLSFLLPDSEPYIGSVEILDIGLHSDFVSGVHSNYQFIEPSIISKLYKPRSKFSHKGTYGHALLLAGEKGKMGAAVLCTKACLRSGAGLASIVVPRDEFLILQTAVPEAMAIDQTALEQLNFKAYATIGVGPGMGTGSHGAYLLQTILAHFNKPIVVDADALTILSTINNLLNDLPPGSILTPHLKEFDRLFNTSENGFDRLQTARYHSQKLFVYIILKGHYTAIACPDGEVFFNSTGNPGMATGGSGDVLTGIVTGLLAQGYQPKDACILGVYLHGLAGDIAAAGNSQEALIARDIISKLGKAFLEISSHEN